VKSEEDAAATAQIPAVPAQRTSAVAVVDTLHTGTMVATAR
jgi:hypothetical protein